MCAGTSGKFTRACFIAEFTKKIEAQRETGSNQSFLTSREKEIVIFFELLTHLHHYAEYSWSLSPQHLYFWRETVGKRRSVSRFRTEIENNIKKPTVPKETRKEQHLIDSDGKRLDQEISKAPKRCVVCLSLKRKDTISQYDNCNVALRIDHFKLYWTIS